MEHHYTSLDDLSYQPYTSVMANQSVKLGLTIATARKNAGLTQKELGLACGYGEDAQSRVSHYERGVRNPTLQDLKKIGKAVGVDYLHLIDSSSAKDVHAVLDPEITALLETLSPDQKVATLQLMRSMAAPKRAAKKKRRR